MDNTTDRHETNFRGADLVVALFICLLLGALLAPAVAQSRGNNRLNSCLNNAKQLMLAFHNHHDTRKTFPLTSTQLITGKPGHFGDDDAAGYSWLVMLLPFLEEPQSFDMLAKASDKLKKPPFDPSVTSVDGKAGVLSRNLAINTYLCPAYLSHLRGEDKAAKDDAEASSDPNANPLEKVASQPQIKPPAISNYHAFAGSNFTNLEGLGRLVPAENLQTLPDGRIVPSKAYEGNGALPFPGMVGGKIMNRGLGIQSISDGTSNTLVFAETIEPEFAAWLDGQVTWLVAAWPSNPDVPEFIEVPQEVSSQQAIGWTEAQLPKNAISLGKHGTQGEDGSKDVYLPAARWSAAKDRVWGPSSYHDGKVTHAWADAHVKMLSDNIDKNVYLRLVTRNGREIIPIEDK